VVRVRFSSAWFSVGASRVSHVMLQGHRWVAIVIANDENIKFFCYLLMPMMKLSISIYDLEYEPMKRPSSYAIFSCSILFVLLMQWPHVLYAFY
jgi:hypothetical protein